MPLCFQSKSNSILTYFNTAASIQKDDCFGTLQICCLLSTNLFKDCNLNLSPFLDNSFQTQFFLRCFCWPHDLHLISSLCWQISCNVSARFTKVDSNSWSDPLHVTQPFFAGIQVKIKTTVNSVDVYGHVTWGPDEDGIQIGCLQLMKSGNYSYLQKSGLKHLIKSFKTRFVLWVRVWVYVCFISPCFPHNPSRKFHNCIDIFFFCIFFLTHKHRVFFDQFENTHFRPFSMFQSTGWPKYQCGTRKNTDDIREEIKNNYWLLILAKSLLHLHLVKASLSWWIVSCTRYSLHLLHLSKQVNCYLSHFQVYPTTLIIKECDNPKNITLTPTIPVRKNSRGEYLFVKFFLPPGLWIMDKKNCLIQMEETKSVTVQIGATCTTLHGSSKLNVVTPMLINHEHSQFWAFFGLPTIWVRNLTLMLRYG